MHINNLHNLLKKIIIVLLNSLVEVISSLLCNYVMQCVRICGHHGRQQDWEDQSSVDNCLHEFPCHIAK